MASLGKASRRGKLARRLRQPSGELGRAEAIVGLRRGRRSKHLFERKERVVCGKLRTDARHERADGRVGAERDDPRERLVENEGECVHVSPSVHPSPLSLFRRRVTRGSERRTHRLCPCSLGERPCQAEVRDAEASPIIVEQKVRRLHVAVDETSGVRVREPVRGLRPDTRHVCRAEGLAVVEQIAKRTPTEILEYEVRAVRVLAPIVDRDEVRVGERGGGLRFRAESPEEGAVGREHRVQHLDRDAPFQADVRREVDVSRSSRPYCCLDPVATGQDAADRVCESCHWELPGH